MKLLIGYDGSESSGDAVHELRRAGLPSDVETTVLSVADLPMAVPYADIGSPAPAAIAMPPAVAVAARQSAAQMVAEAKQTAENGAALVRSLYPTWKVNYESVVESPAWAIIRRAQEHCVDLVVLGSQGRSALGRLVLGSVSQNVLRQANCSVRIGRRDGTAAAPDKAGPVRLVLGVDGSHYAALAISAVAARTWPAGTQVRVVVVLDLRFWVEVASYGAPGWQVGEGIYDDKSWARKAVSAVTRELSEAGLLATAVIQEGNPKHVLIRESESFSADCIFVGAKGHSRIERLLIGSVSMAVAANAPCSVEVVRQG